MCGKKYHKVKIVFFFCVALSHSFSLFAFFFENKSIKRYFKFLGLFIVIHYFFKKVNIMKNHVWLHHVKNDAIKRMFPVLTDSYLFPFNFFSCSPSYAHVNAFICQVEITLIIRLNQGHVKSCFSTIKNIISPLPQCLWPPNLAWLILKSYYPLNYPTHWQRDLLRSHDKLKPLFFRYQNAYDH